jgi:hypothetical protein
MREEALETLATADIDSVQKLQGQLIAFDGVLDYLKEEIR